MRNRSIFLFRIGLAASLFGTCLLAYVVGLAQTGPSWEVPVAVMMQLTLFPKIAFSLALLNLVIWFIERGFKEFPIPSRTGTMMAVMFCFLASILVGVGHPEQWPGRYPMLSGMAVFIVIPI